MRKYHVEVYDSAFLALQEILFFKIEKSQVTSGAIAFRDEILEAIKNLERLPHSGKILNDTYRAKVVSGHWLVYEIDEKQSVIFVSDVIDPQQFSKTGKYL